MEDRRCYNGEGALTPHFNETNFLPALDIERKRYNPENDRGDKYDRGGVLAAFSLLPAKLSLMQSHHLDSAGNFSPLIPLLVSGYPSEHDNNMTYRAGGVVFGVLAPGKNVRTGE